MYIVNSNHLTDLGKFLPSTQPDLMGFAPANVDPMSLSLEEFTDYLDKSLRQHRNQTERWDFEGLVAFLDGIPKTNPHQHITGSVGSPELLKLALQIYQEDPAAREEFLDYATSTDLMRPEIARHFFRLSNNAMLQWMQSHIPLNVAPGSFGQADDRLSLVRLAFQSGHPGTGELLEEAYKSVALENQAHGVSDVWFRTSLGDQDADAFGRVAQSAIRGASQAEAVSNSPLNVRFVVGMRKMWHDSTSGPQTGSPFDTKALGLVAKLGKLREDDSNIARMFLGVDSVGTDSGWQPEWQAPARTMAVSQDMHVAMHFGESWHAGDLLNTLQRLEALARSGDIQQLDNSNALFATRDAENPNQSYSAEAWAEISRIQGSAFKLLIERGIGLGINPTSNDWLTRSLREEEGWRLRGHNEPVNSGEPSVTEMMAPEHGEKQLVMVVGNDNSRIYPSRVKNSYLTVSEELATLWETSGSSETSVFGKFPTKFIAQLILNGFALTQSVGNSQVDAGGFKQWGQSGQLDSTSPLTWPSGHISG